MGSTIRDYTTTEKPCAKYVHNPYSPDKAFEIVHDDAASTQRHQAVAKRMLPPGTSRTDLFGKVPFYPFPEYVHDRTRQRTDAPALQDRPDSLVQLFFGQLPYKVADNAILWLCSTFAQSDVLYIERVMQEKSRKGCMQVFVNEYDADYIIDALNRRVLIDSTGIWQAQNDLETAVLDDHCATNRFKGLPFRVTVVERATSTYVRRKPAAAARTSRSETPQPVVEDDVVTVPEPVECYTSEPCQCPQCTPATTCDYYRYCDCDYYDPYYYNTASYYPPAMPIIDDVEMY